MGRNRKTKTKAKKVTYEGSTLKNVCTRKKRTLRKKRVTFNLDNLSRIQERELLPYRKYVETLKMKIRQRDNQKLNIDIVSDLGFNIKTEQSDYYDFKDVNVKVEQTDLDIKVKEEANINTTDTEKKCSVENYEPVNYDFKLEDIIAKGNLEAEGEYGIQLQVEEDKETHNEENGSSENKGAGYKHRSAFVSIKGVKFIPQPGELKCEAFYLDYYKKIQLEQHNKFCVHLEGHCIQKNQPYYEKSKKLSGLLEKDPSKMLPPCLPAFTTEESKHTDHCQLNKSESNTNTFTTSSQASASKYDNEKDSDAYNSNIFLPEICDSQSNKNTLTAMDIVETETENPLPEISLQDIEDVLNGTSSEIPLQFPNLTFDVLLEEVPSIMDELYNTCIRNVGNCESQLPTLNLQEETPQLELVASPSSSCVINEMIRKQNEVATVVEEIAEFQSDQSVDTLYQDLMEILDADVELVNPRATNTAIPQEQCNCATLGQETIEDFDKEWEKIMAIVQMKKDADPVFATKRNS